MELKIIGKLLITIGSVVVLIGLLFFFFPKFFSFFGKLPGDIAVQNKNFSFYFPVTTCIIISSILTLIFWITGKK